MWLTLLNVLMRQVFKRKNNKTSESTLDKYVALTRMSCVWCLMFELLCVPTEERVASIIHLRRESRHTKKCMSWVSKTIKEAKVVVLRWSVCDLWTLKKLSIFQMLRHFIVDTPANCQTALSKNNMSVQHVRLTGVFLSILGRFLCRHRSKMTLQWTAVAAFLYVEMGVLVILCLPFISARR